MQVFNFQVSIRKWTSSKTELRNFEALVGKMTNLVTNRLQRLRYVFGCLLVGCCCLLMPAIDLLGEKVISSDIQYIVYI